MTTTIYKINNEGREWTIAGPNAADEAAYWSKCGAEVKAVTTTVDDLAVPLSQYSTTDLETLEDIASDNEWTEVITMVRNHQQRLV